MALVMMLIDDHNYNLMMVCVCQRCLKPAPKATVANKSASCAGQRGDAKSKKNNI